MTEEVPQGRLYGVGVGPGDPELLTLKAARLIAAADCVAHFHKAGNGSNARAVAAALIPAGAEELPLAYPVTTEIPKADAAYRAQIDAFYDASAAAVADRLSAGRTVVVLSEGDPLFYGSYMHLHVRLAHRFPTEVVPGVTAMSGCWSLAGVPIVQGDDVLAVLPATLDEATLSARLAGVDAAVVMKVGRHLAKVRRALATAGRLERSIYVERGTMAAGAVHRLADKPDDRAPYFSLVLVPGWEGRP